MLQLFQAARQGQRISKTGNQKTYVVSLVQNQKDLVVMKELLESGKVMPVIDGCYPLSKISEAFWYFEKVHPREKSSSLWSDKVGDSSPTTAWHVSEQVGYSRNFGSCVSTTPPCPVGGALVFW